MYHKLLPEEVFYGTFFISVISVIIYEYLNLCSGISPQISEGTNNFKGGMHFEGSLLDIQKKYIIKEVKKHIDKHEQMFYSKKNTERLFLVKKGDKIWKRMIS